MQYKSKVSTSVQCENFDKLAEFYGLMCNNRRQGKPFDKTAFRYAVKENLLAGIDHFQINEKLYHSVCYSKESVHLSSMQMGIAVEGIWAKLKEKLANLKNKIFGQSKQLGEETAKAGEGVEGAADKLSAKISKLNDSELETPRKVVPWKTIVLVGAAVVAAVGMAATVWANWPAILAGSSAIYNKIKGMAKSIPAIFKKKPASDQAAMDAAMKAGDANVKANVLKYSQLNASALKKQLEAAKVNAAPAKVGWAKSKLSQLWGWIKTIAKFLRNAPKAIWNFITGFFKKKEDNLKDEAKAAPKQEAYGDEGETGVESEEEVKKTGGKMATFFKVLRFLWASTKVVFSIAKSLLFIVAAGWGVGSFFATVGAVLTLKGEKQL